MPIYKYRCGCGAVKHEYRKIDDRDNAPEHCGPMIRELEAAMVSVFTSYRSIVGEKDGGEKPLIRNKAEHEAFLRRNGYEEVGNDRSMAPPHPDELSEKKAKWQDEPTAPMVDIEKLKREGFIQEDFV
jgi:hypothetical protein